MATTLGEPKIIKSVYECKLPDNQNIAGYFNSCEPTYNVPFMSWQNISKIYRDYTPIEEDAVVDVKYSFIRFTFRHSSNELRHGRIEIFDDKVIKLIFLYNPHEIENTFSLEDIIKSLSEFTKINLDLVKNLTLTWIKDVDVWDQKFEEYILLDLITNDNEVSSVLELDESEKCASVKSWYNIIFKITPQIRISLTHEQTTTADKKCNYVTMNLRKVEDQDGLDPESVELFLVKLKQLFAHYNSKSTEIRDKYEKFKTYMTTPFPKALVNGSGCESFFNEKEQTTNGCGFLPVIMDTEANAKRIANDDETRVSADSNDKFYTCSQYQIGAEVELYNTTKKIWENGKITDYKWKTGIKVQPEDATKENIPFKWSDLIKNGNANTVVRIKKLSKDHKYPYFVGKTTTRCCGIKVPNNNEKLSRANQQLTPVEGNKILNSQTPRGYLPTHLKRLFFPFLGSVNEIFYRYGFDYSNASFVDCLVKATNVIKADIIQSMAEKPWLAKQEMYDYSTEEITKLINGNTFIDPRLFVSMLENIVTLSIYIFNANGIIKPRFQNGYYKREPLEGSKAIIIYEQQKEKDHDYPTYELIYLTRRSKDKIEDVMMHDFDSPLIRYCRKALYEMTKTYTVKGLLPEFNNQLQHLY